MESGNQGKRCSIPSMDQGTEEGERQGHSAQVPLSLAGLRLDQALGQMFPAYSRSRHQQWIRGGQVHLNGAVATPRTRVFGGETLRLTPIFEPLIKNLGEAIALKILYEDEALLIVDKPQGLVVHPAAGHPDGTLVNALLHHAPALDRVPRAGLVHRIDKDTSGLLMVAKTVEAHTQLVAQLQARTVHRFYLALVQGALTGGGTIDQPIGRHPTDRKRFAVRRDGKEAITHYRIVERFEAHTLIRVQLETGRTHQIRVHLASIQHPLVGDPVYGGRSRLPKSVTPRLRTILEGFRRQALHAETLGLVHPESGEEMCWESPLPDDFIGLLEGLRDPDSGTCGS